MINTNTDDIFSRELYSLVTKIVNYRFLHNRLFTTNNSIDYDDLIQQGMLYALEAKHTFNPELTSFNTWVTTQVITRLSNFLKENSLVNVSRRETTSGVLPEYIDFNEAPEPPYIEYTLDIDELYDLLYSKCNSLLEPPNNLLVLYYFGVIANERYSLKQLADMFFISKSTAYARIKSSVDVLSRDIDLSNYANIVFKNV